MSYRLNDYEPLNDGSISKSPIHSASVVIGKFESISRHGRRGWKEIWQDAVTDVKQISWTKIGRRFGAFFLPVGLLVVTIIIFLWASVVLTSITAAGPCRPNGTFELSDDPYNPWKSYLTVDMAFGSYSFGMAKFIDIAWDVAAGRAGQALLALVSYRTFTKAIVRAMEKTTVSQDTFSSLTLQHNTLIGLATLIKDFTKNKGVRNRFTMVCIILCGIFILVFPTWMGAMTGYTPELQAYVRDQDGSLANAKDFLPIIYNIHDGQRIGLQPDYPVTAEWDHNEPVASPFVPYMDGDLDQFYGCKSYYANETLANSTDGGINCLWMWRVSRYVHDYGFLALQNVSDSDFYHPNGTVVRIPGPQPLNISASFYGDATLIGHVSTSNNWWEFPYGWNWRGNSETSPLPFLTRNPRFFNNASKTEYDLDTLNRQGSCTPMQPVTYQWGFSFTTLFFFTVAFMIWLCSIWSIYLDSFLNSQLDANQWHMGTDRAIIDISASMRRKLDHDSAELYNTHKLRTLTKGQQITYADLPLDSLKPNRRIQLSRWWRTRPRRSWTLRDARVWARAEKWWLLVLTIFTVLWIAAIASIGDEFFNAWNPSISFLPVLSCIWVLCLGPNCRSRWLLFAICFILFIIFDITLSQVWPY